MALRTNEESYANFLFKLFDLHAKRRLSDMQRSTRLAEVQMIGNCNRITKVSQFHGVSIPLIAPNYQMHSNKVSHLYQSLLIYSSVASDTHREEGIKDQKKIHLG